MGSGMYRVTRFLFDNSLLLIFGALAALVWANLDSESYHHFIDFTFWDHAPIGHLHEAHDGHAAYRSLTLSYLVNDMFMAFFFAIAGKEVWEAIVLKDGALRGRKAATPLFATVGGMLGPITVYLGLALLMGTDVFQEVKNGWAIPTATDIAFSYLVGRIIFGAGHPAIRFLLLLAIADDAAGLIILAVAYPTSTLAPEWLLLSLSAAGIVFFFFNELPRRLDRGKQDRPNSTYIRNAFSFWPYAIAGFASWYGFMQSGLHPALGLLPIVPTIPHANRAFGIFSSAEKHLQDMLNKIEHALKHPVEVVLLLFGLLNAGVTFEAIGPATWLVLSGLLIGKPFGILLFGWLAAKPFNLGLPEGMRLVDLINVGCVSAIGFTVSLFVASVAFDTGTVQDAAKMGALLSFIAALIAFLSARLTKVVRKPL